MAIDSWDIGKLYDIMRANRYGSPKYTRAQLLLNSTYGKSVYANDFVQPLYPLCPHVVTRQVNYFTFETMRLRNRIRMVELMTEARHQSGKSVRHMPAARRKAFRDLIKHQLSGFNSCNIS